MLYGLSSSWEKNILKKLFLSNKEVLLYEALEIGMCDVIKIGLKSRDTTRNKIK